MKKSTFAFILTCIILGLGLPSLAQQHKGHPFEEVGRNLSKKGKELLRIVDNYSRALASDPYNGGYYNNRAAAYFDNGDYRKAILDYSKAIQFTDNKYVNRMARMYYKRGLSYYILGEYNKAVVDFSSAISFRPDISDSYYFRGKVRAMIFNQQSLARQDFMRVLDLAGSPSVQKSFSYLFLSQAQRAEAEAFALLRSIPPINRMDIALMKYNIAGLKALQGDSYQAIRYLEEALRNGYSDKQWLIRDINFRSLIDNREFHNLLYRYGLRYQLDNRVPLYVTGKGVQCDEPTPVQTTRPAALRGYSLNFSDPNRNNRIDIGETSYIVFSLKNEGQGVGRQVSISVQEINRVTGLDYKRNVAVGDMDPGSRIDIKIPVTGMTADKNDVAEFEINVREQNGFDARPMRISIPVSAYMPPIMEVTDYKFASQLGGRVRLGVPIMLKLAVKNSGQGAAEGVQVNFELPENVFTAGEAAFDLQNMAPGEMRILDFEFFTNTRYSSDLIPIVVQITDANGKYKKRQNLILKLDAQLEVADRVVITSVPDPAVDIKPQDIQLTSDVDRNIPRSGNRNANGIAVVIGNRDYQNPDVPRVDYALQDAASMRKYLEEAYGFDPNNIIFLSNATQADFNGTFGTKDDHKARLFNLVKENESDVFVFYSGHGAPDLETEEAYFVPVDCDPSLVRFNGYAINTLYNNLAKIPYRTLTVVLDACFSGTSDRGTLIPRASLVRIKSSANSIFKDPKAMIFTSATGTQIASWYPEQQHGLFTYYFLKGLQGAANEDKDRKLTLGEMKAYINDNVPYMARRMNNRTQTPEVFGAVEGVLLDY